MSAQLVPTAWTAGTTEVFKTGTWRSVLPQHIARPSPCHQACPVNGDIAQWIGHARAGDLRRAWEVLTVNNPFPAIAGRVCHHPCETACNRVAYDAAVSVCRLERAAGDEAIARDWAYAPPAQERNGHVAVIGGGPSGLSAAYQLRRRGWRVTLYEARPQLGGVMRYGIPAYRLARSVLDAEIDRIVALGVQVKTGVPVADAQAFERIKASHDAVYVATGASRPKSLPQLPESANWWMSGMEYLARCASGERPRIGRRVLVVGGGSAAMDVARSARRAGCEVALLALEPRARMPAQPAELHEALEEGVLLHDGAMLRTVVEQGGAVSLGCIRVHFEGGAPGAPPRFAPVEGSEFTLEADTILVAIGQDAELGTLAPLAAAAGVLQVDATQRTSVENVWAGGDVASMQRFVTEAVGMGKRAAIDIDAKLRGIAPPSAERAPCTQAKEIATWYHAPAARAPERVREAADRLAAGSIEVQLPLSPAEVRAEAARCFSCGTCTSCDNCFQLCPDLAIEHVPGGGYKVLADYCKGCGVCVRECPTGSMLLNEELR
jgi:NADPH-dependent glutamate synthase beta subunit-like oxidoreductase/Pyruvate/2-oxoacid:ferredoxin oxidoreductase delta subunit